MSITDVETAVGGALDTLEDFGHWLHGNEAGIRCALVDPILWALGWSTWQPWECLPDWRMARGGQVDYALLGQDNQVAVLVDVNGQPARRRQDRLRLERRLRGMTRGIGVLTYGSEWEIYDLGVRRLRFDDRRVERLVLSHDAADGSRRVAEVLHTWLRRDQWWT